MARTTAAVLFVVALFLAVVSAAKIKSPTKEWRKQLAGPPSEFPEYYPPTPEEAALTSSSAYIPVTLQSVKTEEGQLWQWKGTFPVDSNSHLTISVMCAQRKDLLIYAQPPGGWPLTLLSDDIFTIHGAKGQKTEHEFGMGETKLMVTSYIFPDPISGVWNFEVRSKVEIKHPANKPSLYLLVGNDSPNKVVSYLNTYQLQLGQEVGLVAKVVEAASVTDAERSAFLPAITNLAAVDAEMEVILPDGKDIIVKMKDDGNSNDLLANDGVYGAVIEAVEVGIYTVITSVRATTAQGVEFLRNNLHTFAVVPPDATLTGLARASYITEQTVLQFDIDVDILAPFTNDNTVKVKAYAEVWGTDSTGLGYVPVAWVQSMVDVEQRSDGRTVITLDLHKDWIQMAKAAAPFQLRNVEIQNTDYNVPLSQRDVIFVEMPESDVSNLASVVDYTVTPVITEAMLKGPRPRALQNASLTAAARKLLLVHGYCAGVNEFPPSQFENSAVFADYKQSRSNDQFALLIKQFGDQFESFSTVAHSQGGLASMHLLTYYWSALDVRPANGGRTVQSVGSPYQGTSLAGFLADIGWLIGFGCGSNTDLSTNGAANWLSKIPMDARNNVYYYTTQYDDYWFVLPNNCVTAANVVLSKPNDGTTERHRAVVPGAHDMGNKKGWCHTNGMKYPNQCSDPARNADMNRAAAR